MNENDKEGISIGDILLLIAMLAFFAFLAYGMDSMTEKEMDAPFMPYTEYYTKYYEQECEEEFIQEGAYFGNIEAQMIYLNKEDTIEFNINVTGVNNGVKDPVICFINDDIHPFEYDDFLEYSGMLVTSANNDIYLTTPTTISNIRDFVMYAKCVPIGCTNEEHRYINGGYNGTYNIKINYVSPHRASKEDIMGIWVDDHNGNVSEGVPPKLIATIIGSEKIRYL